MMDNELRTKIKQLLFEVSEELNNPKPKTFLHQIEIVEDVVRIKRFKGIIDPIKMASWLIPEIGQVFRFDFERPETNRKEKIILAKKVFSINEINDYIREYILELDGHTEKINRNNKSSKQIDSSVSEKNEQEKVNLQEVVSSKLKEKEAKQKVLEKFPKNVRKANKVWKLSTTQIYNKYFEQDFPNLKDKNTITRYIKKFRSEQK